MNNFKIFEKGPLNRDMWLRAKDPNQLEVMRLRKLLYPNAKNSNPCFATIFPDGACMQKKTE